MDASHQPKQGEASKKSRPWLILSAVALVLSLGIYSGAGMIASARQAALPPRVIELPLVDVASARPMPQHFTIVEEGFLRPRAEIEVIAEVSGKVVEVSPKLEPGGTFDEGELLFRIDPRTFKADLARAEADAVAARAELSRAKAENDRQMRLQEIGASAQANREQASAAFASARAAMGQAEAQLILAQKRFDDTEVRAPFTASVISENVALGRFVQPGQSTATIYDISAGEVVLGLLPADAEAVRRAVANSSGPAKATIVPSRASASTSRIEGQVKRFSGAVDRRSRTVPVVVDVPGAFSTGAAYANDFVRVELPAYSAEQLYAVPNGAVRQERFLWIITNGNELHSVDVQQMQRTDKETIIRSSEDLSGASIVITALTEEREGLKVAVNSKTTTADQQEILR
ncbi:MAG: efflux RND transporter periplasmic adaptor subunit [Pseudomonadota bacterium]